jgi:hypothetical protein
MCIDVMIKIIESVDFYGFGNIIVIHFNCTAELEIVKSAFLKSLLPITSLSIFSKIFSASCKSLSATGAG